MSSRTPRTDAVALIPDDGLREHRLWLLAQKLEEELGMETERVSLLQADLGRAAERIISIRRALTSIAGTDYRGNRTPEATLAAQALKEDEAP